MEAPRLSLSITREKWFPVFAKNDAQTAASIQTQALPEFGKIDAQAKKTFIDPNAGFCRSLVKLMREQRG
jgi:hypothetical protein